MTQHFDLIVLGAGSGGISTAVKASRLGAKVLLIEKQDLGGTCVNVGCVPKKIMWYASQLADGIERSHAYGFERTHAHLNWDTLVEKRQAYIERIHASYKNTFQKHNITTVSGHAQFIAYNQVGVNDEVFQAPHIVIATGGSPTQPSWPGASLGITSDGFFELKQCPKKTAVIGAGYIAVELAGILQSLGSKTHLCIRHDMPLRDFDDMVSGTAKRFLEHQGVHIHTQFNVQALEKQPNEQFCLVSQDGTRLQDFDCVIWAIGRSPMLEELNLEVIGLSPNEKGLLEINDQYETSVKGVYALGDITPYPHLTPVAIRSGRRLACLLFGGEPLAFNPKRVPSVIFSHPPIGSVGYTEKEAIEQFGKANIKVYTESFKPMYESLMDDPILFHIKLITQGPEETVIGCHLAGLGVDEMLQGFAVAMQAGATKKDFDNTIAIHPTSSEELVLLS